MAATFLFISEVTLPIQSIVCYYREQMHFWGNGGRHMPYVAHSDAFFSLGGSRAYWRLKAQQ